MTFGSCGHCTQCQTGAPAYCLGGFALQFGGQRADGSTTLDATPLITGTGEPGATVVITVDGEQLGNVTVDTNGNWVLAVTTRLTNDVHTVEAVATDTAGNTDAATSTFTVNASTDLAQLHGGGVLHGKGG